MPVAPHVRRAGPYLLGPKLGMSPVKSIVQCLARKEGTDDFYQVLNNIFLNLQKYQNGTMKKMKRCQVNSLPKHVLKKFYCYIGLLFVFSRLSY
jgi:hypothetical protein